MRRTTNLTLCMLVTCCAAAGHADTPPAAGGAKRANEKGAPATRTGDEIPPRTEPMLEERALDLKVKPWINPDLPEDERPELVWVRAVWGMTEKHHYKYWEKKREWGDFYYWYYVWSDVARYKGKLVVAFQEINRPHSYGDAVHHVIVSEDDGKTWKSVAHYEFPSVSRPKSNVALGWGTTKFDLTSDGRLAMKGRAGFGGVEFWQATAFTEDGRTWTPLKKWKLNGRIGGPGEIFRAAWHNGRCYGGSRPGSVWRSKDADGLDWERIEVAVPMDGRVCGNETAATFAGDRLILFMRSGQISSSKPPYTHWDVNMTPYRGSHSHGGPNLKTLPNGVVLAGSRGSIPQYGDRGLALIFRYNGKQLTPVLAFHSGAWATGYPGFWWDDGYFYMSFQRDNHLARLRPGEKPPEMPKGRGIPSAYAAGWPQKRGLICVAKFKWPLKRDVKSVDQVYAEREQDFKRWKPAKLVEVRKIWDKAPSNALSDLIRFADTWYCAFREADAFRHPFWPEQGRPGSLKAGRISVITSPDGVNWTPSASTSKEGADLFDPKFSVTAERKLALHVNCAEFAPARGRSKTPRVAAAYPMAMFSEDGRKWSEPQKAACKGIKPPGSFWISPLAWNSRRGYCFIRAENPGGRSAGGGHLASTTDGLTFKIEQYQHERKRHVPSRRYGLSSLMYMFRCNYSVDVALVGKSILVRTGQRHHQVGTAKPPYRVWDVRNVTFDPPGRCEMANLLVGPDGRRWMAGQRLGDGKLVLFELREDMAKAVLELPFVLSSRIGKTSVGMALHEGSLWLSFHSSHESKKTGKDSSIYLARIQLPEKAE